MGLFSSTFGMTEKEVAAEIIYDKLVSPTYDWKVARHPFEQERDKVYVSYDDFKHNNMAVIGFTHLCCDGYINRGYPNSLFYPNQDFLDRINSKLATLSEEDIKNKIGCRCETCKSWGFIPGTEEYNKKFGNQGVGT